MSYVLSIEIKVYMKEERERVSSKNYVNLFSRKCTNLFSSMLCIQNPSFYVIGIFIELFDNLMKLNVYMIFSM